MVSACPSIHSRYGLEPSCDFPIFLRFRTHNIKRRGTKEYSNDNYLYFSKKIIRLQKLNIVKYYKYLAHLNQRLIGELIVYPCSGIRRRCCRCQPFSKVFSSETAWPIKAKFYVEPPWEGGTKVCINGPGHMTKMVAMPIYG